MAKNKKSLQTTDHPDAAVDKKVMDEKLQEVSVPENQAGIVEKSTEAAETELKNQDRITDKEIRQKIEEMDLSDALKPHVQQQVAKVQSLKEQEKIQYLLALAKHKGIVFAVKIAQKMNDPYVLDMLHDTLEKEGYYKKFTK